MSVCEVSDKLMRQLPCSGIVGFVMQYPGFLRLHGINPSRVFLFDRDHCQQVWRLIQEVQA